MEKRNNQKVKKRTNGLLLIGLTVLLVVGISVGIVVYQNKEPKQNTPLLPQPPQNPNPIPLPPIPLPPLPIPRNNHFEAILATGQEPEYKTNPPLPISSVGTDYNTADQTHLPAGSALMTDTLDGSGKGDSILNSKGITHIIHAAPNPRSSFTSDQDFINCVVKSVQNSIILADRNNFECLAIPLVGGGTYRGKEDNHFAGELKNFKLKGIEVRTRDIREINEALHKSSVIVNAANTHIGFGSGVSGAIAEQVGDKTKIEVKARELIGKFFNPLPSPTPPTNNDPKLEIEVWCNYQTISNNPPDNFEDYYRFCCLDILPDNTNTSKSIPQNFRAEYSYKLTILAKDKDKKIFEVDDFVELELKKNNQCLISIQKENRRLHSENFLAYLRQICEKTNRPLKEINEIYFTSQPSGQTGLRISLAFLATYQVLNPKVKLYHINTLLLQAGDSSCISLLTIDSQESKHYLAVYQNKKCLLETQTVKQEDLEKLTKKFPDFLILKDFQSIDFLTNFQKLKNKFVLMDTIEEIDY
ncbi:2942_t:CDS:2 [Funneliformis geosporum]|uniref:2942_t:CDS:1 n=1 Tax=Funneliformis geosporum TaxID=1117311 RepID=A0A9W4SB61_9GLOM|nr:2942_t:CDS:2 [Funneliformis geosporum]